MRKRIVSFLVGLDAIAEFFKQQQEEEEEFSQYGEEIPVQNHHIVHTVHTEYDSVVKQWRGY